MISIGDLVRLKPPKLTVNFEDRQKVRTSTGAKTEIIKGKRSYSHLKSFVFIVLREHTAGPGAVIVAVVSHDKFKRTHPLSGCSNVYERNCVVGAQYTLPAESLEILS